MYGKICILFNEWRWEMRYILVCKTFLRKNYVDFCMFMKGDLIWYVKSIYDTDSEMGFGEIIDFVKSYVLVCGANFGMN